MYDWPLSYWGIGLCWTFITTSRIQVWKCTVGGTSYCRGESYYIWIKWTLRVFGPRIRGSGVVNTTPCLAPGIHNSLDFTTLWSSQHHSLLQCPLMILDLYLHVYAIPYSVLNVMSLKQKSLLLVSRSRYIPYLNLVSIKVLLYSVNCPSVSLSLSLLFIFFPFFKNDFCWKMFLYRSSGRGLSLPLAPRMVSTMSTRISVLYCSWYTPACYLFSFFSPVKIVLWQRELSRSYDARIKQLEQDLLESKSEVSRVESSMAEALAAKNTEIGALIVSMDALKKQAALSEGSLASMQVRGSHCVFVVMYYELWLWK